MFCFDSLHPPTAKSKKLVDVLFYLMWIQIVFSILRMIIGQFTTAFTDLISAFILYQGYSQLSYCNMVFYIFITGISSLHLITLVGTIIQNGYHPFLNPLFNPYFGVFPAIVEYLSVIFYAVALYYTFQAYREFKALALEMGSGGFIPQMVNRNDQPSYGGAGYGALSNIYIK